MLSAHYRRVLNFSAESMDAAKASLGRIRTCVSTLNDRIRDAKMQDLTEDERKKLGPDENGNKIPLTEIASDPVTGAALRPDDMRVYRYDFEQPMDDDLNTADAEADEPIYKLHRLTTGLVKAETQSAMIGVYEQNHILTEEEEHIYRRGRNAKAHTHAKNADIQEYRRATGFEALCGYLYLARDMDRLHDISTIIRTEYKDRIHEKKRRQKSISVQG